MTADEAEEPTITVRKYAYEVPVSCCLMTSMTGVNHCQHPPPPPVSKWRTTRWRLRSWWFANRPHIHRGPCDVEGDW